MTLVFLLLAADAPASVASETKRALRLDMAGGVVWQPTAADLVGPSVGASVLYDGELFSVGGGIGYAFAPLELVRYQGAQHSLDLVALGELHPFFRSWLQPRLDLAVHLRVSTQAVRAKNAAALEAVGAQANESARYVSGVFELGLRGDVPLGHDFAIFVRVATGVLVRREQALPDQSAISARLAISAQLGVARTF